MKGAKKRSSSKKRRVLTKNRETKRRILTNLSKMTNKEVKNELYGMENLSLWLYRNDEGIVKDKEYQDFFENLQLLREEACGRRLKGCCCQQESAFLMCVECGEMITMKRSSQVKDTEKRIAFGVCPRCGKWLVK